MKKIDCAACTIVSKNYFAHARTLYQSFARHNPDARFFVLLVDRNDGEIDLSKEPFEVIEASSLGITDFLQLAFQFDIVELNTSVKPTFLRFLIQKRGVSRLLYLDPDILVYRPMDEAFGLLESNKIVLTPHCNSPINDDLRPSEQDLLGRGVFNLGFIGVRDNPESLRFLDWWEKRCLSLGFAEVRTGLFVDQKWVDFAACFFSGVYVLRNLGYNVAYWNLHERRLQNIGGQWRANDQPLAFFHFSGINVADTNQISRHQNRYDLNSRPDVRSLFDEYRALLISNGLKDFASLKYAYGTFSNGDTITQIARRLYAAHRAEYSTPNPFLTSSNVYRWCKLNAFLGGPDQSDKYNSMTYREDNYLIKFIHGVLRALLFIMGSNRYTLLMKYLSHVSILRNQKNVFPCGKTKIRG